MSPHPAVTGRKTSSSRKFVSAAGEIRVPESAGRGFEVRTELIEKLTVRKEQIRALELVS